MRLKLPWSKGFRRAPAAARGARICAKHSSLVDPRLSSVNDGYSTLNPKMQATAWGGGFNRSTQRYG